MKSVHSEDIVSMTDKKIEDLYGDSEEKVASKKFERIQYLIEEGHRRLDAFKDEDISVFVGNTRCGKSAIVNVLIGNELVAEKGKWKVSLALDETQDNKPGPAIGNKPVSETTIPGRYETSQEGFGIIWDCPGFADNRGVTQDIANSFYIKKLFENARSVKIYLVTDFSDIDSDSIKSFIDTMQSLEFMFGDNITHLIANKSIAMIVNKINGDFNVEDIKGCYREKFLDVKAINKGAHTEKLMEYFLDNDDTIAILPRITTIGTEIGDQLLAPMERLAINYIPAKGNLKVQPGLSPEAKNFIHVSYNGGGLLSKFRDFFSEIDKMQEKVVIDLHDVTDKSALQTSLADYRQKLDAVAKAKIEIESTNSLEGASKILLRLFPNCLQIEAATDHIQRYFEENSIISEAAFLDFLTSPISEKAENAVKAMTMSFSSKLSTYYAKIIDDANEILGRITAEENKQKLNEMSEQHKKAMAESNQKHKEAMDEMGRKLTATQNDLSSYKKKLDDAKGELKTAENNARYYKDQNDKTEAWLKNAQNELSNTKSELKNANNNIDLYKEEMAKASKRAKNYEKQLSDTKDEMFSYKSKFYDYKDRLDSTNREHEKKMSVLKDQIKTQDKLESMIAGLTTQLEQTKAATLQAQAEAAQARVAADNRMAEFVTLIAQKDAELDRRAHAMWDKDKVMQQRYDHIMKLKAKVNKMKKTHYVLEEKFDNPLLNEHELLQKVYSLYGSKQCNKLIDLTSDLTPDEVKDFIYSDKPIEFIGAMLNIHSLESSVFYE